MNLSPLANTGIVVAGLWSVVVGLLGYVALHGGRRRARMAARIGLALLVLLSAALVGLAWWYAANFELVF